MEPYLVTVAAIDDDTGSRAQVVLSRCPWPAAQAESEEGEELLSLAEIERETQRRKDDGGSAVRL